MGKKTNIYIRKIMLFQQNISKRKQSDQTTRKVPVMLHIIFDKK